jgi:fanconi-associated nuclease 1
MDAFVQRKVPHNSSSTVPRSPRRNLDGYPAKRVKTEIADSEDDSEDDLGTSAPHGRAGLVRKEDFQNTVDDDAGLDGSSKLPGRTAIESSLPEIESDEDAIEKYKAYRASQTEEEEDGGDAASRLRNRDWIRGKSSLYVDAFNLALSTVLDDESHLFDEKERSLFDQWSRLSYEAQYL